MRRIVTGYVGLALCVLAFLGACAGSEAFDPGDVNINGSSVAIDNTNLNWSITLSSIASETASVDIQIKLRVPGATTFFYTSPLHVETLGANETKTFTYTEASVSVPAGTTSYEYEISFLPVILQ